MKTNKIAVIGLGYVGLPLAIEYSKHFKTVGFDVNKTRVTELINRIDANDELLPSQITQLREVQFSHCSDAIKDATIYIVTLPTPVAIDNQPDLSFLIEASELIGIFLCEGDLVIYESTVYPGATEETCIPVLEKVSGLELNDDFGVGYSPERINPGDQSRPLSSIVKVTSGSNEHWAKQVDSLYQTIIHAGTHLAPSIKVAEASKVIENIQRDVNIALVNQLSQLFSVLKIDTADVLAAAGTKWNFLNFKPGLVGGHCIGVDPYYLCHKAETVGYFPDIILAARRLNENMSSFISDQILQLMCEKKIPIFSSKILFLGITFKENCSDIRNSKVPDIYKKLEQYGADCTLCDPLVNIKKIYDQNKIKIVDDCSHLSDSYFDAIILSVAHDTFLHHWNDYKLKLKKQGVVYDIKSCLSRDKIDRRL